jgi:hypothetical protein
MVKVNRLRKLIIITIPLAILILIMPILRIMGGIFFSAKEELNRKNIIKVIEENNQIVVSADDLFLQFNKNPYELEKIYKNKILQISGIFDYIGIPKDNPPMKDNSYIIFTDRNNPNNIIICYFTNSEIVPEMKFDEVMENQIITLFGRYRNIKYENGLYLEIGDCEIFY